MENFDDIYNRYLITKNCDNCNCLLNECSKSVKCMDHDHTTGLFRNILCLSCNVKRK